MPLPRPKTDVPRENVGGQVDLMLLNDAVKEIDVREQPDGRFTITPRGVESPVPTPALTVAIGTPKPPRRTRKPSARRKRAKKKTTKR
jgi:hypothetical protein